jgi:hypothetical protein
VLNNRGTEGSGSGGWTDQQNPIGTIMGSVQQMDLNQGTGTDHGRIGSSPTSLGNAVRRRNNSFSFYLLALLDLSSVNVMILFGVSLEKKTRQNASPCNFVYIYVRGVWRVCRDWRFSFSPRCSFACFYPLHLERWLLWDYFCPCKEV